MPASWGPSEHDLNEAALYEITEMAMDTGGASPENASVDEDEGDFDYGFYDPDSDAEGIYLMQQRLWLSLMPIMHQMVILYLVLM